MKSKNIAMVFVFISVLLTIGIGITMTVLRTKSLLEEDHITSSGEEEIVIEKEEHHHDSYVTPYEDKKIITMEEGYEKLITYETQYLYDRYNRLYSCKTSVDPIYKKYDFFGFPYCLQMMQVPIDLQVTEELVPNVSRYLVGQNIWNEQFSYHYDEKGRLEAVSVYPKLRIQYLYDDLNRLSKVNVIGETEEESYTFSYTYEVGSDNLQNIYLNDIKIASLTYDEEDGRLHYMDTYKNSFRFSDYLYDIKSERFEFSYYSDGAVKSIDHNEGSEFLRILFEKTDDKIGKAIVNKRHNRKEYYNYKYDGDLITGYEYKAYDYTDLNLLLNVQYVYTGH